MLPIYLYGHSVLRTVSQDIDPHQEGLDDLIAQMRESMYESEGIGLAAPQIGKNIRLVVIDARVLGDTYPEVKDLNLVLINPHIESFGTTTCKEPEGCLSVPGIQETVERPESIVIRYLDENRVAHVDTFEGYAARVIQHEYDHLEGKLFVDHVSPLRKQLIKNKLLAIQKGRVRTDYPVVFAPKRRK